MKAIRSETGLSLTDFAKTLQLGRSKYIDIEKGRKLPSPQDALWITKLMGLPDDWLSQDDPGVNELFAAADALKRLAEEEK